MTVPHGANSAPFEVGSSAPDAEADSPMAATEGMTTDVASSIDDGGIRSRSAAVFDRVRRLEVSTIYLVIAVPFGVLFALLIPPSQVLDESAHWFRVWQISDGNIIADTATVGGREVNVGSYPQCVREFVDAMQERAAEPRPFSIDDYWWDAPACDGTNVRVEGEAMGSYSLWTYPGHTVGVSIARALQLPLPFQFFVGRLFGLATSIGLCWYAISRAPRAQLAMAVVALLPMSLMGAAGFSPDGLVLGCSLVLISSALRFGLGPATMARRHVAIVAACLLALTLSKPPYILFALLFLCYRGDSFGDARRTRRALGSVTAVTLALTMIWNRIGFPQGAIEVFRPGIDQTGQVRWILTHPLEYLNVVVDSMLSWESQLFVLQGWVGAFGMFRTGVGDSPLIPPFFVLVAVATLAWFTSAEYDPAPGPREPGSTRRSLMTIAVVPIFVLALYTSAYVAWDAVGADRIYGIQGRYFLAVLVLPAAALAFRRSDARASYPSWSIAPGALLLVGTASVKIWTYFY